MHQQGEFRTPAIRRGLAAATRRRGIASLSGPWASAVYPTSTRGRDVLEVQTSAGNQATTVLLIQRRRSQESESAAPVLPRSTLLEMALARLKEPELEWIPAVQGLRSRLETDLKSAAGPDEPEARRRADRLVKMLSLTQGAFGPLAQMTRPENYLPSLQKRIVAEVEAIRQAYGAALFASYSHADMDDQVLAIAEGRMRTFPGYVVREYLGKNGIETLLPSLAQLSGQIRQLRHLSGHGPRKLDAVVSLSPGGQEWEQSETEMRQELQKARAAQSGDAGKAVEAVQALTSKVQLRASAMTALALYEQFYLWRHQVDDTFAVLFLSAKPYHATRRAELELERIVGDFESPTWPMMDPDAAKDISEQGMIDLAAFVGSDEFDQAIALVKERLKTISTINVIATIAVITAAAALTAGAAAAAVGGLLQVAGVTGWALGLGTLAAESFAFTLTSRAGQEIAFGKTEGSLLRDWATNFLMFGTLKGANKAFDSIFTLAPSAGLGAKAAYGMGKTATSLIALQGFAEGEQLISKGRFMSGDERTQTAVQNVVLTVLLSAGRFITAPVEARISGAIAAKLRPKFQARLESLATERLTLKSELGSIGRYQDVEPGRVATLLTKIQELWTKELQLLTSGAQRKVLSQADVEVAARSYNAKIAELDLQLARLNTNVRLSTGERLFRPVQPGVVAFSEGGAQPLREFHTSQKGSLTESKTFPGALEGRIRGELTYYLPERDAGRFLRAGEAAKVAGVRDQALREAAGDPVIKQGLDKLNNLFGAAKGDDVLAAARPEDLGNFLRSLADPDIGGFNRPEYYRELARQPAAVEFAQNYGAKTMRNLAQKLNWTESLIKDFLPRATAALERAPADRRPALLEALRSESDPIKLDALVGKERPPAKPKTPQVTKKNMGVDRSAADWSRFQIREARGAVARLELTLDPQILAQRADVLQILERAKQGRFKRLSHEERVRLVDRFDALGVAAGMGRDG